MAKYSLNLGESYVPEWGTWEVGREIICNAKDADPNFKIKYLNSDCIEVYTSTVPTECELMVMGLSQSRDDDGAIGQFGEGFKLAALVATRSGGCVQVHSPKGLMKFKLEKMADSPVRVLFAYTDKRRKRNEGCITQVEMPGLSEAVHGKFVDANMVMLEKESQGDCKIFSKGVYITTLKEENSIWDWNLNQIRLNRDRSVPRMFDIKYGIAKFLSKVHDGNIWEKIFESSKSFEVSCLSAYGYFHQMAGVADTVKEVWHKVFGNKAVLPSSIDLHNQIATAKGYNVIMMDFPGHLFDIPSSDNVIESNDLHEEVEVSMKIMEEVNSALELLEVPAVVKFFKHKNDTLGEAVFEGGQLLVWLSDYLAKPGNRVLRLSTLAHEIGHLTSKSGDANIDFEASLDRIAGKLLIKLLDRR